MFQVQEAAGGLWSILDDQRREVFRGTRRDCEDWLDQQDNAPPAHAAATFRLADWIGLIVGKPAPTKPAATPTHTSGNEG